MTRAEKVVKIAKMLKRKFPKLMELESVELAYEILLIVEEL